MTETRVEVSVRWFCVWDNQKSIFLLFKPINEHGISTYINQLNSNVNSKYYFQILIFIAPPAFSQKDRDVNFTI